MFTTLSTAISALNANSIAVSAVGNDLANLDTTGYKTTEVAFESLMAETMVNNDEGNTLYTRDGTFTTGSNGYLVDANGLRVQGWSAGANGVVNTNGPTGDISIPSGTLFPPVASTKVTLSMNLNSAAIAGTTSG